MVRLYGARKERMNNPPVAASEINDIRNRMDAKTVPEGECLVWIGSLHRGYGRIQYRGRRWKVHRLTWVVERGPIPEGLGVLHTCDNRRCRNLKHLFLGDALANNRDRDCKGRGSAGRGEGHGHAVLTWAAVAEIRESTQPARVFADKYGVKIETIRRVRRRETWIV